MNKRRCRLGARECDHATDRITCIGGMYMQCASCKLSWYICKCGVTPHSKHSTKKGSVMLTHVRREGRGCHSVAEVEAVVLCIRNTFGYSHPEEETSDDVSTGTAMPCPMRDWGAPAWCPIRSGLVPLAELQKYGLRDDANETFCSLGMLPLLLLHCFRGL